MTNRQSFPGLRTCLNVQSVLHADVRIRAGRLPGVVQRFIACLTGRMSTQRNGAAQVNDLLERLFGARGVEVLHLARGGVNLGSPRTRDGRVVARAVDHCVHVLERAAQGFAVVQVGQPRLERCVPQPQPGTVAAGDRHDVVSRRGRSRQCVLAQHAGRSEDCHAHRSPR